MVPSENSETTGVVGTDVGSPRPISTRRLWALALGGSFLAGLLAWAIGENFLQYFRPPTVSVTAMGSSFDVVSREHQAAAERKNAVLAFGVLGGLLGLMLGLAGGLSRGLTTSGWLAGVVGAAVGSFAGAASSWFLLGIYFNQELISFEEFSGDLLLPTLVRGGISAIIGAAAGLALGLGARAKRAPLISSVAGGLIGGVLGAAIYELVGAWLFPSDDSNRPTPGAWPPRLLAMLFISILIGTCSVFALLSPSRPRRGLAVQPEPDPA